MGCEPSKEGDFSVLTGSNEHEAQLLLEVPGAEVDVVSSSNKEGAIVARGQFQLLRLRPTDQLDGPGQYVVLRQAKVAPDMIPGSGEAGVADRYIEHGAAINVLEVVELASHQRIRARVEDPPGWISLYDTKSKYRWVRKLEVAVFHVGGSSDGQGFYYPMTEGSEVPVLLVYETRVMTINAGDGDTFAIRLPSTMSDEQLYALAEMLPNYCNFKLSKQKDVHDYVTGAAGGIADAIGFGAGLLAKGIQMSGQQARRNIEPQQEVKVSAGTQIAVGATKHAAVGTVAVAGAVVDGLLSAAVYLGKQAGKQAAGGSSSPSQPSAPPAPETSSSKAGKAVLMGGLQVFDALLKASDKLSTTAADETAGVVGHKYGAAAGSIARDGLTTAGAALELQDMVGKKAVGKLAAKGAMYTAGGMVQGAVQKGA